MSTQKSVAFVCTNNKQVEKEIRKTILFTIASKNVKCIGRNLTLFIHLLRERPLQ
jgi:hypothetical protein